MQAEPGCLQTGVHHVQPQRHLGQFHGGAVEVHAVAVVQGDVGLGLLQLDGISLRVEARPQLPLTPPQVLGGNLVDRLVEEGPGAQRRLADRPVQQLAGGRRGAILVEAVSERELDGHLGQ